MQLVFQGADGGTETGDELVDLIQATHWLLYLDEGAWTMWRVAKAGKWSAGTIEVVFACDKSTVKARQGLLFKLAHKDLACAQMLKNNELLMKARQGR